MGTIQVRMGGGQTVVVSTHRYDEYGHQPQVHPDTYLKQNGHIEVFHRILKRALFQILYLLYNGA